MAYLVNLTSRAGRDLANPYAEINAGQSDTILKWYLGLKKAILSLEYYSTRSTATLETKELRHLL